MKVALPVDGILAEAQGIVRQSNLVVVAPPGSGKTTRIPPALLAVISGEILVLQPRRLAARLAARRVAEELSETVGETVGYQVRFDERSGPKTRIRFVTEAIVTRRLLSDPRLSGVGAVILDEFHERHIHTDLTLALLRRLQHARPDLRLVVMSATLDPEPVAGYLGGCPILRTEGRVFEVAIEHLREPDDRRLEAQVASAVRKLLQTDCGDVLVFLPGAAEIARAHEACALFSAQAQIVKLHGDLSPQEQDLAVHASERRKVILSTNVAETSITIEGVGAVVDSGLARIAGHSSWSGISTLRVAKISRASAAQRAGRAGRTRAGTCVRLYTRHDHDTRPAFETPELQRLDLCETLLMLAGLGISELDWFEPPKQAAKDAATDLLARLGAVDGLGALTPLGKELLRFPVHPRLARMIVEGERRGAAREACRVAALLGERGSRKEARPVTAASDLLDELDGHGQAMQAFRQLTRICRKNSASTGGDDALGMAVLAGFSDRVAKRRRPKERALLLSSGGEIELSDASSVREAELMVIVDAEDRTGSRSNLIARRASAILPEWLLDLFPEYLKDQNEIEWNARAERAEVVSRVLYEKLVLEETRRAPSNEVEARQASARLAEEAIRVGLRKFVDEEELDRWQGRLAFVASACPNLGFVSPDLSLVDVCQGLRSFAELRQLDLLGAIKNQLPLAQAGKLAKLAPERVTLRSGRSARIMYELGKPPWIASRLQDFFGMQRTPMVADGRVSLVVHLLAPSQRPVQVTADLEGFWTRHYPAIRRELMRKYPKHAWPEDPMTG